VFSHCVQLHPTWETFGEVMGEVASKNKNSRDRNDDDVDAPEDDDDDDDDDDGDDDDDDDDDYQKFSEDEYKHGKNVTLPVVIDCESRLCRKYLYLQYPRTNSCLSNRPCVCL